MQPLSEVPTRQTLKLKAVEVFGRDKAASAWFKTKAMGLDGQRPEELLGSRGSRE